MKEGVFTGIPNEVYHADRTAVSSTWVKLINEKTPWHLRSYLDSPPADPTPALVMGAAVDCLIFEPKMWDRQFIIHPVINRRTNAGKEEWAALEARAKKEHKYLIDEAKREEAMLTAKSVRTNPRMADVLKRGVAQQVVVWRDPVTGLLCKCRTDWYDKKDQTIYDLKAMLDASPDGFSRAVHNFSYHIQAAFYWDGYLTAGLPVKRFVFGVQEKPDNRNTFVADPRLMSWYTLTLKDIEAGQDSYTSALAAINACMENEEWPGYSNEIIEITRPPWAKRTDIDDVVAL